MRTHLCVVKWNVGRRCVPRSTVHQKTRVYLLVEECRTIVQGARGNGSQRNISSTSQVSTRRPRTRLHQSSASASICQHQLFCVTRRAGDTTPFHPCSPSRMSVCMHMRTLEHPSTYERTVRSKKRTYLGTTLCPNFQVFAHFEQLPIVNYGAFVKGALAQSSAAVAVAMWWPT